MARDKLAKCCNSCGQILDPSRGLPLRAKVPAFKSALGTVRGWWAYACSPECLVKVKASIAKDQKDTLDYLAQGR